MKDYEMQEDLILDEEEREIDLLESGVYYYDGNPDRLEFMNWRDSVW